jgi:hypothetical protein
MKSAVTNLYVFRYNYLLIVLNISHYMLVSFIFKQLQASNIVFTFVRADYKSILKNMKIKVFTLVLSIILISSVGMAQKRYVSTTGTDASNLCDVPGNPCATISRAITKSVDGDTILVYPGMLFSSYTQSAPIVVNKSVAIIGVSDTLPINNRKPVLKTTVPDLFEVKAKKVTIQGFRMEFGLTSTSGMNGIVTPNGIYDSLKILNNEFISTKIITPDFAVPDAYAIHIFGYDSLGYVTIKGNIIRPLSEVPFENDVFGRGIELGYEGNLLLQYGCGGAIGGPGTDSNLIAARWPIKGNSLTSDLIVENNTLYGESAILNPYKGNVTFTGNRCSTGGAYVAPYLAYVFNAIENNGTQLNVVNNTFSEYSNIGAFFGECRNANITGNTFEPLSGATDYVSLVFNTKFETSGSPAPHYASEATVKGNNFKGAGTPGNSTTAIRISDHNAGLNPPFQNFIIGGIPAGEKNIFDLNNKWFIFLDTATGPSNKLLIWLRTGSGITTMAPVDDDFTALQVENTYNCTGTELETKLFHHPDTAVLGTINVGPAGMAENGNAANSLFYPVPLKKGGILTYTTDDLITGSVNCEITDVTGRIISSSVIPVNGKKSFAIPFAGKLDHGVYLVRFLSNGVVIHCGKIAVQ